MENNDNNIKIRRYLVIGISLIIVGVGVFFSDYLISKKKGAYERFTFEMTEMTEEIISPPGEEVSDKDINDTETIKKEEVYGNATIEKEEEVYVNHYNYIGRIEIPRINLVKGFVSKDSRDNNVNKNVAIMNPSDYPDVPNGNFILASHNGNGWNSYFRNLHKLHVGDVAHIYYHGLKYNYKIVNIYKVKKTGKVMVYRNPDVTTLTLITCTKGDKKTQTVFICELVDVQSE